MLQRFFERHPAVKVEALQVVKEINRILDGNYVDERAISFDVLFPFFFDSMPVEARRTWAVDAGLCRIVVERRNRLQGGVAPIVQLLRTRLPESVVTQLERRGDGWRSRQYRHYKLLTSYIKSTARVCYRYDLVDFYRGKGLAVFGRRIDQALCYLSAFLLYDDDLFDFSDDLRKKKQTILTQFVEIHGGHSDELQLELIRLMTPILAKVKLLKLESEPLSDFVSSLEEVYAIGPT